MKIAMSVLLGLKPLQEKFNNQVLPVKIAYKFSKLFKRVNEELEFYTNAVNQIINDYAIKDEEGKPKQQESGNGIMIKPDCIDVAQKKFSDLMNLEVEFDDIFFTLDEFNNANISISVEDFSHLLPFIKE